MIDSKRMRVVERDKDLYLLIYKKALWLLISHLNSTSPL